MTTGVYCKQTFTLSKMDHYEFALFGLAPKCSVRFVPPCLCL
jgi:hypothetical protein